MNKTDTNTTEHLCRNSINHNNNTFMAMTFIHKTFHKKWQIIFSDFVASYSVSMTWCHADYTDHIQHHEMLHLGTLLSWKGCHKSNIVISIHKTLSVGVHIGLSADQCYKIYREHETVLCINPIMLYHLQPAEYLVSQHSGQLNHQQEFCL